MKTSTLIGLPLVHEANVMVCLCHVFCMPRQLIRVCDALPTTILLGDGDGKDWRGDIFATPSYFFTILSVVCL